MIGGRKLISLCISRLHDIENNRFIARLNEQLRNQNCSLLIYNITTDLFWKDSDLRPEIAVFDLIDYERTDAVIIMDEKIKSHAVTRSIISRSKEHDIPVIVVDGEYEDSICVEFDYPSGFEKIVRHVIEEHGARSIRFIGGFKGNRFSDEREEAVRKVAAENGIPFDESMVYYGEFWAKPAIAAVEKIIASGDIPDAVFCANDIMAINVSSVFMNHGIKVPEQVIVTGFDGIDEIDFTVPRITSASTSYQELADKVFSALQALLSGERIEGSIKVEPVLLLNESCGCTSSADDSRMLRSFNNRFYHYQDEYVKLNGITDVIQEKKEMLSAAEVLYSDVVENMCCIINKECADNTHDYYRTKREKPFGDTMFMFFNSDDIPLRQYDIQRSDMVPDLEEKLESGYPLIFNCIYCMNMPVGYICFCFRNYDITEYGKIMAVANAIGRGVGGFINMRYQRYLIERVESMYMYDYLTGLYNRTSFNKKYNEAISELPYGSEITVVLSDLDGLKEINDNYGHFSGDRAISTVASALKKACPPGAICVRYGGDEMIGFIAGACDKDAITADIRAVIEEHNADSGSSYKLSASIGIVSEKLSDKTDIEELIERADKLMYIEKHSKKKKKEI